MKKPNSPLELVLLKASETMIDRAIETHLKDPRSSFLSCGDVERLLAVIHHLKAISVRIGVAVDA